MDLCVVRVELACKSEPAAWSDKVFGVTLPTFGDF